MRNFNAQRWCQLITLLAAVLLLWIGGQAKSSAIQQRFNPTQAPPRAQYAGSAACASCHAEIARKHQASAMGQALASGGENAVLQKHKALEFRLGNYRYRIAREGERSLYSVTDGAVTITEPILWAFGSAQQGQTYVLRHNGQFYESRVSFFRDTQALDLTLGAPRSAPANLTEAFGRLMNSADTKDCFGCHAAAAVSAGQLQLDQLKPGVTCESCHGPGAEHIATVKASRQAQGVRDLRIFNPARLSPYDLSQQFCGACHRSWEEIMTQGQKGVGNVRFQPYRLHFSKCFDAEDARISCTACHDAHGAVETKLATYDAQCLACHQSKAAASVPSAKGTKARAPACKTGTANCASCHMPRIEIPGSHFKFTDHLIRIVKPGEAYPN
jgi:predicted CXXCH cytochrome family protein